ncbi:AP2-like ethylene-responsive transcription factor CRL5 [Sesamum alatum]|uniref:AP2-like ethylene-responsive transcription factor CRL5 n=1 Tax=Sesamum alatum TaxID=300844 RepID=A0AAE2CTX2_9LAMI|nr:AP2-like ethylene-responsive transcription factor CRL5 [Sesamum alatum]
MMPVKDDNNGSNLNNWWGFSLSPHMKMEPNNTSSPSFYLPSNGEFHSPLQVMPLKSDGSLCILEALSRSHSEGSSPKLEDFLGGATMAHERDAMVLSLDSAYYNQEPFRQQYYSGLNFSSSGLPSMPEGTEFPCLKTWADHGQELEHQQVNNTTSATGFDELKCLSLSMSPGSQTSSCVTNSRQISPTEATECVAMETKKRGSEKMAQVKQTVHRKSIDTFGQRTSQYRGVTRHRWTGRYEAHLWDNSCKKEGQTRKGRQGGYDMEEKAARAYDLAALKYWGPSTHINFPLENYHQELEEMKNMSRQEYVAHLRRRSSGFSRGASMYRGVTRHHQHGRWQARIGRVAGNKDLYLGTFSTQEEAAEAYDVAAIKFRGVNAVTNFDISRYDVEKIMASNTLPTGEVARRNKESEPTAETAQRSDQENVNLKSTTGGSYHNPLFSAALQHDLINTASTQLAGPRHFSNPSSLVTSLSNSSEPSPDRNGALSAKPDTFETKFINSSTNLNSWIPVTQPRPLPLTTTHLPVFAAWNDA